VHQQLKPIVMLRQHSHLLRPIKQITQLVELVMVMELEMELVQALEQK